MAIPTPSLLIGPPELYNSTAAEPFVDLSPPPKGLTENCSATFLSSGDPCLDFFFHVVPDTPPESITQRLESAWAHDPLATLKLICNLRGVRGTGKNDKEGFYTTALWLHQHHPKTLACNVMSFADFGYFKDLPEILYRLLEGSDVRKIQKAEWLQRQPKTFRKYIRGRGFMKIRINSSKKKKKSNRPRQPVTLSMFFRNLKVTDMVKINPEKERARELRNDKRIAMAKKVVQRYGSDPDFRFLYERISDCFAECMKSDVVFLNSKDHEKKISLAAKWCPSIASSFDRSTLLCESIARKIFPRESHPEYREIEEAHYAYRIRDRLRKEILVPLRKALELPEVYIGANRWNEIPYSRVASVAMKIHKDKFLKHDEERFRNYLNDVKEGKSKISAGALLPHEIVASLDWYGEEENENDVAELQWKRMVGDLLKRGKLKNCIAVCDVSGSMEGTPMKVSVALGLLVSELSVNPWKGKVITFSQDPQLHLIEGDDLASKTRFVREMGWGMNTDFQKVFDNILKVAVDGKLKAEEMIKTVFVFSDMEFDEASENEWETDYEAIKRKFGDEGYGEAVPEIVFWNLRDSTSTPATVSDKGVALVSGFSKNLMKMFLDGSGEINPKAIMEKAISGEEYQRLVVLD